MIAVLTLVVSLGADRVVAGTMSYRSVPIDWLPIGKQLGIACIIAGMVLRYFYVQQQLREQEQSELQSRIQALQSRIRPHFLFNSMNIIASLISVDPETAESVVEDLSELFRASLNDAGNQVLLTRRARAVRALRADRTTAFGRSAAARVGHRRVSGRSEDSAADACSRCWRTRSITASSRCPTAAPLR